MKQHITIRICILLVKVEHKIQLRCMGCIDSSPGNSSVVGLIQFSNRPVKSQGVLK